MKIWSLLFKKFWHIFLNILDLFGNYTICRRWVFISCCYQKIWSRWLRLFFPPANIEYFKFEGHMFCAETYLHCLGLKPKTILLDVFPAALELWAEQERDAPSLPDAEFSGRIFHYSCCIFGVSVHLSPPKSMGFLLLLFLPELVQAGIIWNWVVLRAFSPELLLFYKKGERNFLSLKVLRNLIHTVYLFLC